MVDDEIDALNEKKSSFNLTKTLEQDLELLNTTKYNINKTSFLISKLKIGKNLIEESKAELEQSVSHIDLQQLRLLYNETTANISSIQKNFEDLVAYHNNMVVEKLKYIFENLPKLSKNLKTSHENLVMLLKQEKELTDKVAKGDSLEVLEKVIFVLNEKYRIKGEYESIIS